MKQMVSKNNKEISNFGMRLSYERKRLGYTQSTLAGLLNKSTVTQVKYESGETRPDADYFFGLDELGADIYYIITGEQLEALKKDDERELVGGYRMMDQRVKDAVLNLVGVITIDAPNKIPVKNKK